MSAVQLIQKSLVPGLIIICSTVLNILSQASYFRKTLDWISVIITFGKHFSSIEGIGIMLEINKNLNKKINRNSIRLMYKK